MGKYGKSAGNVWEDYWKSAGKVRGVLNAIIFFLAFAKKI
jgi:hypothetical protein